MSRHPSLTLGLIALLTVSCAPLPAPIPAPATATSSAALPNPASVYCEQQGGRLVIHSDATGAQSGICRFADGSIIEGAGTHAGFSPRGRWFVLGNGAGPGLQLWDRDRGAHHRLAEWQLCGWQDEEPWLSLPEDAQLMSLHALLGRRAGRT